MDILYVRINSESIGDVVFPDTCTHLLLNEQFLTLTCKDVSYRIYILTLSLCQKPLALDGVGECKCQNNNANGFRIVFYIAKISTLSISRDKNVLRLSKLHVCTRAHIVYHFYVGEFSG